MYAWLLLSTAGGAHPPVTTKHGDGVVCNFLFPGMEDCLEDFWAVMGRCWGPAGGELRAREQPKKHPK